MRLPIGTHVQWETDKNVKSSYAHRSTSGFIYSYVGCKNGEACLSVDRSRGQKGQFVVHPLGVFPTHMLEPFTGTLSWARQLECDAWRKQRGIELDEYKDSKDEGYD